MSTHTPASEALPAVAGDGHRWTLLARIPAAPRQALLWLPALGVAARHYLPLAEALAAQGVAVFLHEWRGNGSSALRPSRAQDWGYRQLLCEDLPASHAAIAQRAALPLAIGGHSLGGQIACCYAALHPRAFAQLWLVASGTPYWRQFAAPRRYLLPLAYRFLPWLAQRQGVLHGRRLGFGGTEARSLIADWARVGLSNRYAAAGMAADLEALLAQVTAPVRGVVLQDDWLAPATSLRALLRKLAPRTLELHSLDAAQLGAAADHFAWMKRPAAVAQALLGSAD
ncbi:putative alpha/beta hydrolase [Xanthomonas sp. JAI131]|uniref:alpha/beta hydrolase family protein n=1 Tax=Xanthomonas sp. JAI131 TaxID=2723067 RepID=UPI0015CD409C|nr:alpha/beta fold hydrolase [Xanthomonas sp. JAI131]NYF19099.1 putative alpha/beta hydrolase [Xanthomonas sp. JAI131]